ncbi:MAG TPA: hypothetical protein VOA88_15895 [Candidatus Dormibacteraeota bacterium]|nr:hypothetical protein [Candidatus Dormibacteraeota bacterium]
MKLFILALFLACLICVSPTPAEIFQSQFLRFQLPDGWHCHLEDDVFVCYPPLPKGHKAPTIIILAAKIAGDDDTLPGYMAYLRKNRSVTGASSLVEGPKIADDIGKVKWVEATHFESEIPEFYTTYLATTWNGLSILVTFSGHKSVFPRFRDLILSCINSMEVKDDWKKHTKK